MAKIFPPRNLPGESEKWGREVESRIVQAESSSSRESGSLNNTSRMFSGQLAVLSRQIEELLERSVQITVAPDLTGSGTSGNLPTYTTSVLVPGKSVTRHALVSIYFETFESGSGVGNVEVRAGGQTVRSLYPGESSNGSSPIIVPPGGVLVEISMTLQGFTTEPFQMTLSNIKISTLFGDRA